MCRENQAMRQRLAAIQYEQYGLTFCNYCGIELVPGASVKRGVSVVRAPNTATLEHILPKSKGGKLTLDNCMLACLECNWERLDNDNYVSKYFREEE